MYLHLEARLKDVDDAVRQFHKYKCFNARLHWFQRLQQGAKVIRMESACEETREKRQGRAVKVGEPGMRGTRSASERGKGRDRPNAVKKKRLNARHV